MEVGAYRGDVTPIIPLFAARARNGDAYPALAGVGTPQGLSPNTLAEGGQSVGRIYFDVVGAPPDSVVYNNGQLVWVGAVPAAPGQPAQNQMLPHDAIPPGAHGPSPRGR